jgi:predicted HD phosphohydrolase
LSELFGPDVTEPIRLHVAAKRYRCAIEPDYLGSLSPASIQSLAAQGGPFSQEQAHEFARSDHAAAAVTLRGWDDRGKVEGLVITPLDAYRPLLQKWALA